MEPFKELEVHFDTWRLTTNDNESLEESEKTRSKKNDWRFSMPHRYMFVCVLPLLQTTRSKLWGGNTHSYHQQDIQIHSKKCNVPCKKSIEISFLGFARWSALISSMRSCLRSRIDEVSFFTVLNESWMSFYWNLIPASDTVLTTQYLAGERMSSDVSSCCCWRVVFT